MNNGTCLHALELFVAISELPTWSLTYFEGTLMVQTGGHGVDIWKWVEALEMFCLTKTIGV